MSLDPVKTNLFKGQIGQTHTPLNVAVQSSNPSTLQSSSTSKVGEFCSGFLAPFKAIARGIAWIFRTLFCCCASAKLKEQELKDMMKFVTIFSLPLDKKERQSLTSLAMDLMSNQKIESCIKTSMAKLPNVKLSKERIEEVVKGCKEGESEHSKVQSNLQLLNDTIVLFLRKDFEGIKNSENTTLTRGFQAMVLIANDLKSIGLNQYDSCKHAAVVESAFKTQKKLALNQAACEALKKSVSQSTGLMMTEQALIGRMIDDRLSNHDKSFHLPEDVLINKVNPEICQYLRQALLS